MAIPCMLLWGLESWTFSIQTIMVSTISVEYAAAQSIAHNVLVLYFMFTLGIAISASALIGKFIGSGEVHKGKRYMRSFLTMGGLMATF